MLPFQDGGQKDLPTGQVFTSQEPSVMKYQLGLMWVPYFETKCGT